MCGSGTRPRVAIVDFGLGNLFSVARACELAGFQAVTTSSAAEVMASDAVVLPGVGAFGNAMDSLRHLDLVEPLRELAASGKPLLGVCLGMQLLMSESHEFGRHQGLGIVEGEVVRLEESPDGPRRLKVPQIGWNRIYKVPTNSDSVMADCSWSETLLSGTADGEFMYFVHSFYSRPVDDSVVVSTTKYGTAEFCSSLRLGNVFACQFHPERSGPQGLSIYSNLAQMVMASGPLGREEA